MFSTWVRRVKIDLTKLVKRIIDPASTGAVLLDIPLGPKLKPAPADDDANCFSVAKAEAIANAGPMD